MRRAFIVLNCLISLQAFAFWPSDTIILDGRIVEIDRRVEVDTVWVDPPTPTETEKTRVGVWEIEGFVGARFSRYRASSLITELDPLEIFVEDKVQVVAGFDIAVEMRRSWNEKWALRSGIGLAYQGWNGADTDPSSFSDSLFRFYSPEPGQLYQIERIRYPDLGTETDTIAQPWSNSEFRYWSLEIPLIASYIVPVREWGRSHHFEAGAGLVNRLNLLNRSGSVMMLNEEGAFEKVERNDLERPTLSVLGRVELGWYYTSKKSQNSLGVRAYFQTPFKPVSFSGDQLELQGSESGLGVFLRFFCK